MEDVHEYIHTHSKESLSQPVQCFDEKRRRKSEKKMEKEKSSL